MLKMIPKIGLEIHIYPNSSRKLFCKCLASREKGLKPNSNICPICCGVPGSKPMLPSKSAIEKAIIVGLMLNCKIRKKLIWMRKHYGWPDLPKGYQNTISGKEDVSIGFDGQFEEIGIWSMHLEEDPAAWDPKTGEVDYNRSGIPLLEIVSAPDFNSSEQVVQWLKKLIHNLEYLKAIDSNAGIKVDVNVNIPGKSQRVEIKNINSLENISKAIDYEIARQIKEGGFVKETRRFDAEKNKTFVMRSKEESQDYRFISDPDLVNINLTDQFINNLKNSLPESPSIKLDKLIKKYGIDEKNAKVLAKNLEVVEFYEYVSSKIDPIYVLPWITVELLRFLNYNKCSLGEINLNPDHFVNLLNLVKEKKITEQQAKKTLDEFYPKSFDPTKNVKEKISNNFEIEKLVSNVLDSEKNAVQKYFNGDKKIINYLIGQVMKLSDGRADFIIVKKILENKLI